MRRLHLHQVTNSRRGFKSGSLPRTRQSITTIPVKFIKVEPPPGSFMVPHTKNGKRRVHSCGCMENVHPSILFTYLLLINRCLVAGSGKSVLWWVTKLGSFDNAYI